MFCESVLLQVHGIATSTNNSLSCQGTTTNIFLNSKRKTTNATTL
jgi:hypothetical protein